MAETRSNLEKLGKRILAAVKKELYFDMPYLEHALGSLYEVLDLSARAMGTDMMSVRFHTQYVFENYMERPGKLNRVYMHLLLHNLLLHPWKAQEWKGETERKLWDLSCDIAVESIVDSMDVPSLRMVTADFRDEWYQILQNKLRTLTAERIFQYLSESSPGSEILMRLEKEFRMDDHVFWDRLKAGEDDKAHDIPDDIQISPMTDLPLKETWEKVAQAVELSVEQSGSANTQESGRLSWNLQLLHARRRDYRLLLEKFMRHREVAETDPESFDPAYYWYGFSHYGNMPLIEELEGKETARIENLVIAIDTSASTRRHHVVKFLSETVAMLRNKEYFFDKMDIHIIECDDRVQKDIRITGINQLESYTGRFAVSGGYGTDYRPVFSYIRELRCKGSMRSLAGVLYFTDGFGVYPDIVTDYDTAFVFVTDEDYDDTGVPPWAMKLYV